MKTIRFLFEYCSGNIFIYDEDGHLCAVNLPKEVRDDKEIVSLYEDIEEKFDSTIMNEKGEIDVDREGPPFKTVREEMDFVREVCCFVKLLKDRLGDKYKFVDEYWEELVWYYWPVE